MVGGAVRVPLLNTQGTTSIQPVVLAQAFAVTWVGTEGGPSALSSAGVVSPS